MTAPAASVSGGRLPQGVVSVLAAHQRRVGAGPLAERNVARIAQHDASVVVTGQQPGLFGGPLLSFHKAVGAIAHARALAAITGRTVVPVFWVASEDHDVAEIDRAVVIDAAGRPRKLSLGLPSDRRSVADVLLDPDSIARCLAELAAALPATERGAAAVELVRPPAGADVGSWFATVLARVLGDSGLVFVEPHHVTPFAGDVFATLVDRAEQIESAIAAEGIARRERGAPAPLEREPGRMPLFVRKAPGGPRERVARDTPGLSALVRAKPELASGDVVGRVFIQNAMLPVAQIVAGPTELAYLEQIGAGARASGHSFPTLVARPSAIWLDAKSAEALAAFHLDARDVADGRAEAPVADAVPDALSDGLEDLARRATELRERATSERSPDGGPSCAVRDLDAVRGDLDKASRRRLDELEASAGRGRARFERLVTALRPLGEPQERVLSAISLLARHSLPPVREGLFALSTTTSPRVITLA